MGVYPCVLARCQCRLDSRVTDGLVLIGLGQLAIRDFEYHSFHSIAFASRPSDDRVIRLAALDDELGVFDCENRVLEPVVLVWLSASDAIESLQRQSQAWAVQQLVSGTDGSSSASQES